MPDHKAHAPAGLAARLTRTVVAAVVFGLSVFAALAADALLRRRAIDAHLATAFILFASGAAVAYLLAHPVASRLGARQAPATRLALILFLLIVGTAGGAAFFSFLHFRIHLVEGLPPPFTYEWADGVVFNGLAVGYGFAILGLPLLLPFGLIPLFVAAFGFAHAADRL